MRGQCICVLTAWDFKHCRYGLSSLVATPSAYFTSNTYTKHWGTKQKSWQLCAKRRPRRPSGRHDATHWAWDHNPPLGQDPQVQNHGSTANYDTMCEEWWCHNILSCHITSSYVYLKPLYAIPVHIKLSVDLGLLERSLEASWHAGITYGVTKCLQSGYGVCCTSGPF